MKRLKRVYVEIGNVCNLQCDFCPPVERAKAAMDEPFFAKVLADVAPLADEVCLHLMGEPLNHPLLGRFIEICAAHAVPVNLTTNAVLLTGARKDLLLHPIVRQVNLSVHSFEANFGESEVTPYLDRVLGWVKRALVERPDLYLNLRLWDLAEPTALSAKSRLVRDRIQADFGFDFGSLSIDVRRKKGYRVTGRLYVSFDSRFTWPSLQLPVRGDRGFCHGLSTHVGILADGTVVPCCLDKEAAIPLGNLHESALAEVLGSRRAEAMRTGFADRRLVEDLCQRCPFIQRFDRKRPGAKVRREALEPCMLPTREELIERFALAPHPEGGYFRESFRAPRDARGRSASTAIYFLLPRGERSKLHRLKSDEVWHFYLGGPLVVVEIDAKGVVTETRLGHNLARGDVLQHVVPAGHWFGAYPAAGSAYSLVGCTVAPGFEFDDFEMADREDLVVRFPQVEGLIRLMT